MIDLVRDRRAMQYAPTVLRRRSLSLQASSSVVGWVQRSETQRPVGESDRQEAIAYSLACADRLFRTLLIIKNNGIDVRL